jgi:hypothetical protein
MSDTIAAPREESKTITISREEYDEMVEDQKFLDCLRAAGVDNWDGYSFAQEMMKSEW